MKGGVSMNEVLKEKRKASGFTQSQMADKLKCTEQYYNLIENGHRRPSHERAQLIGKILKIDWTDFYKEGEL